MPLRTEWVPPEQFMTYKGVKIYHTYRNDDLDDSVSDHVYTIDRYDTNYKCPDPGKYMFDVRGLPTWVKPPYPPFIDIREDSKAEQKHKSGLWRRFRGSGIEMKHVKQAIRKAISQGIIETGKELKMIHT